MADTTLMQSRAEAKYVRLSARKARVVLDHIRGRTVPEDSVEDEDTRIVDWPR